MSTPYNQDYSPPVPVLHVRLSAPGDAPQSGLLTGIVDTGSDGTLVPSSVLEAVEAIAVGDAVLRGILGDTRVVHLFEVDLHLEDVVLPGVLAAADDQGQEVILGRNVINKLILMLDGPAAELVLVGERPGRR
jgi:hypothetical protein